MNEAEAKKAEKELRDIAACITHAIGPGLGFALFICTGPTWSYISNAQRFDVVKTMNEWLEKTATVDGAVFGSAHENETPEKATARLALERKCADLGQTIGDVTKLCAFLFDFGDGGNLAFYTNANMRDVRAGVAGWVKDVKGRS